MKFETLLPALALLAGSVFLGGMGGDIRYCPGGIVHISMACPVESPEAVARREREYRAEQARAVARTQNRLSETAPPQQPSGDRVARDPVGRAHVGREISRTHP